MPLVTLCWVPCDGLASHTGGSSNIPSRFKLQKPELGTCPDKPAGSFNPLDWKQMYLSLPEQTTLTPKCKWLLSPEKRLLLETYSGIAGGCIQEVHSVTYLIYLI